MNDTITALATPPGKGGVAVIRISGPLVPVIAENILGEVPAPRVARFTAFLDQHNEFLDEGLAIFFPNPHSFTGEDVLELQGHGGPVVVDLILQRILSLGARLARPGEFSERAFLNGKIDLTQAEAIADLIDASSKQAAKSALRSLQGEFSKAVKALTESVIQVRLFVEAAIDFADEEIDFLSDARLQVQLQALLQELASIQEKAKQGSFLREGIQVVITGAPNVGKSSLLNALSGKDVAIVTPIPGTTRDVLRDYILIDGMPMHIVDTAGLRESTDLVEQEGIRRAHQEIIKADLILCMVDATQEQSVWPTYTQPVIFIRNKIDLLNESPKVAEENNQMIISLSVQSGAGLELLKHQIKTQVGFDTTTEGLYLARRRHLDALKRVYQHLTAGLEQLNVTGSGELLAEDLRQAQLALNEITGEFTADDLLGRIFSSFCIGK